MSEWMYVSMYEWQISKFTQQFQWQANIVCRDEASCERIWSHQVKLLSLHFYQARGRDRERRDTTRQAEIGRKSRGVYRAESVRLGIQKRQRGAYSEELLSCSYCIRNSLSIGFRHKRKCTKNGKLCKMLQSGKVASRAGCNLALGRSGFDVFSLPKPKTGENCQTKKYYRYSLSLSLSLFLI